MDIALQNTLKRHTLILASNSPRRKQLLNDVGFNFIVRVIETSESLIEGLSVEDQVMNLAKEKALAQKDVLQENEIVITADTIVVQNNLILGKPKSINEARMFLKRYSNSSHRVLTGICLHSSSKTKTFFEETKVYFNPISDEVISEYLHQGTYSDKAGAYGIQDSIGKWCISKIDGCYYNVMGFPIAKFALELKTFLEKS